MIVINIQEEFPHLANAPAVEAIIEFRFAGNPSINERTVRARFEGRDTGYVYLDSQSAFEHRLAIKQGNPPTQEMRDLGWTAVRYRSQDERYVVSLGREIFVLSRLAPYEDWGKLRDEAMRLWAIHAETVLPSEILRSGLRFINRIEAIGEVIELDDYLICGPKLPNGLQLPLTGFLHQESLEVPGHPYGINITRTLQPELIDGIVRNWLILDLDVFTVNAISVHPNVIIEKLAEMRWLKNKAFFGSIREEVIAKLRMDGK